MMGRSGAKCIALVMTPTEAKAKNGSRRRDGKRAQKSSRLDQKLLAGGTKAAEQKNCQAGITSARTNPRGGE